MTNTKSIAHQQKDKGASEVLDGVTLLTVNELSKILKSSTVTIRRMVSRRDIPCYRTEKKILFKRSEVEEYLNKRHIGAADAPYDELAL